MRDHDIDLDTTGSPRQRERREADASDATRREVSRALEHGRPDALGSKALLHLQRAAGNAGTAALVSGEEESPVKDVVASAGQPLDRDTQRDMEGRFGTDFSDVQVHTDSQAAHSAQSVSAQAYTVGNHVVFGEGKYQPGTDEGRHMIAHELTHVVQQRNGPVDGTPAAGGVKISDPSDRFEREADQNASDVLKAETASPATDGAVQRQAAGEEEEEDLQKMALQRAEEEEPAEEEPAASEPAAEAPAEEKEEEQA